MSDMMLKTPTAMDAVIWSPKSEPKSGDSGCLAQEIVGGYAVILPTTTAMDSTEATARMKSSQTKDGSMHSVTLARAVHTLLPTSVASDSKGGVSCVQGARAERPGLLTLADMGSLCLLPTPLAVSVRHSKRVSAAKAQGSVSFRSRLNGEEAPNGLEDWLQFHGLMPSPVAQDYRRRGPNFRQKGLPEVCHRLLHTPIADGQRPEADERGGLRGDVPGERRIPRFEGWEGFPAQPPVCRGDDGLPFGVADLSIPFGRWRREAIKALGNAWVPEVAYEIFRIIQLVEDGHDYD